MDYFGLHHTERHHQIIEQIRDLSPRDAIVVEVGAYVGGSTISFIGQERKVFCVDPWPWTIENYDNNDTLIKEMIQRGGGTAIFQKFCENHKESLFKTVFPIRGFSTEVAKIFPFKIDLIYFDGDHSYEGFKTDFLSWRHLFKDTTIISGDDYGFHFLGLRRAIHELIGEQNLESFHPEKIIWHAHAKNLSK